VKNQILSSFSALITEKIGKVVFARRGRRRGRDNSTAIAGLDRLFGRSCEMSGLTGGKSKEMRVFLLLWRGLFVLLVVVNKDRQGRVDLSTDRRYE